ncbi:MAG: aminopeptidase P family protein [Treponema sp.]|nr:aminopeptidase P family protein [Treponema sp.]
MKQYTKEQLKEIYRTRRNTLAAKLREYDTGACVFIDSEEHRDPAVAYFTNHANDAVLIIFSDGYSVLIAWDENLAKQNAFYDKLVPYMRYKNDAKDATKAILNACATHAENSKVELPPYLTYPDYLKFIDSLNNYDCRCKEDGLHKFVVESRMIKDEYEIECTREAARVGDLIIDEIESQIKNGKIQTETDVALLIEKMLRENGCQRTGFDTLAAGPSRSFAIHAFPGYTAAQWPAQGLSILDFGVVYNGYTSDTTLTVAKGPLTPAQEKQLELVQKAYDAALNLYKPGRPIMDAAKKCDSVFAAAKRKMPHGLGHAIGLEIHEQPRVNPRVAPEKVFKPGMILTCEPGLYDVEIGGTRLENDVLITEDGNEVITHSRIIRI